MQQGIRQGPSVPTDGTPFPKMTRTDLGLMSRDAADADDAVDGKMRTIRMKLDRRNFRSPSRTVLSALCLGLLCGEAPI